METFKYSLSKAIHQKFDVNIHNFQFKDEYIYKKDKYYGLKYFIIDTISILHQIHSQNYIHNDIKPNNFMLRNNTCEFSVYYGNGFKLIDFGFMTYIELHDKSIKLNHYRGTCGYSPPEMKPFANKYEP